MLPVIELRGAIPYGIALGANPVSVAVAAIAGNMIPIPFLIIYTRKVFAWLRRFPKAGKIVAWLENRAHTKSAAIHKYGFWGLCILVTIPLPGTGAWTGVRASGHCPWRLDCCRHYDRSQCRVAGLRSRVRRKKVGVYNDFFCIVTI